MLPWIRGVLAPDLTPFDRRLTTLTRHADTHGAVAS